MKKLLLKASTDSPAVLLTGATGFLGGAFLAHLVENGYSGQVVCLVRGRREETAQERLCESLRRFGIHLAYGLPRNVSVLEGDMLSRDWHDDPVLDRVSDVIHLAANTSFGNNLGIGETNIEGTLSVARAMRGRRNLRRYLHVGTAAICGAHPPSLVYEDDYPADVTHVVPYTASKAEAENLLRAFSDLPLVIARPSIVMGHTRLGCRPSGSIFWVFRAIRALRFVTWSLANRIDVIPVDWAAAALARLLFAPTLSHTTYHVSAGSSGAVQWRDAMSGLSIQKGRLAELTPERVAALGSGHPRHLQRALKLYYRFCSVNLAFDNQRLLSEGVPQAPSFFDYMDLCLSTSPGSIYDQMRLDLGHQPVAA